LAQAFGHRHTDKLGHRFLSRMSLLRLSVVTLGCDQANIEVDPSSSPGEVLIALGDLAAAECGVQLVLLYEERMLTSDATLAESGVVDGSTLTLVRTMLSEAQQHAINETLVQAARNGRLEEVKRLLFEAGANCNGTDFWGDTPLLEAAEKGQLEVLKYLIQAGAKVDTSDSIGRIPLSRAAGNGQLEVVKYLVEEAGAKVGTQDSIGCSPLLLAAQEGRLEVAKYLVGKAGAEVNATDNEGQTPLYWADKCSHSEVAAFLRANGGCIYDSDRQQ